MPYTCTKCGKKYEDTPVAIVMGGGFPDDNICGECVGKY